jgi:REP element-mobilizing transposase RayT
MKQKHWLRLSYHLILAFAPEGTLSSPEHRALIERSLLENASDAKWRVEAAACLMDHLHIVVSTGDNITMTTLVRLLKTRVAKCARESGICSGRRFWQPGSFAISTSSSEVEELRRFLATQDTVHSAISLGEEVRRLARKAGISQRQALPFLTNGTKPRSRAKPRATFVSEEMLHAA